MKSELRIERKELSMKKNLTELVFILDRSGSMAGLESDTIGGFNGMLSKQKKEEGDLIVTTVLFDDQYELLHDRIPAAGVPPMTEEQYYVRGCTALLDAIGTTIQKIINVQKHTLESERAEKVIFIIITDGLENASGEYTYKRVRRLIETEKKLYGWEFLFLGANMDAGEEAERFGIERERAANYMSDSKGTRMCYEAVSKSVAYMRADMEITAEWKDELEEDVKARRKSS